MSVDVNLDALTLVAQAPMPLLISQANCGLLGLNERKFLELLREAGPALDVIECDQLRCVSPVEFTAWMRQRAARKKAQKAAKQSGAQPDGDEDLAPLVAKYGLAQVAGPRKGK
jgi:hypothetical protein